MKKGFFLRLTALLATALLLLPMLFACAPESDPLAVTSFQKLEITENEKIRAEVTLSLADVEAHKGETAYLYELLPGEGVGDLAKKDPVATAPISSFMSFEIDLKSEDHSRLYSSFSIYYQNGTPMFSSPRMLDIHSATAPLSPSYLWKENPKGLVLSDAASAAALGCPHAMVEIRLSALLTEGDLSLTFGGKQFTVSTATLTEADEQIREAYRAGMQVSLRVIADGITTDALSRTALLDFLADRYTKEENGMITAIYVDASALSVEEIASFASTAHKALFSRISTGRIYILSPESTVLGAKAFFAELGEQLSKASPFSWGAALSLPAINGFSADEQDSLVITPTSLSQITTALKKQTAAPSYFALCDIAITKVDPTLQAVHYAYVYANAQKADMDAIFYASQSSDAYGLYAPDGSKREIAEAFRTIDASLSPDLLHLCRTVSEEIYTAVKELESSRRVLAGSANTGAGSGKSDYLFDFTTGDCYGFFPVGSQPLPKGQANPISHQSGAHNESVLFAFLRDGAPQNGIRKLLSNGDALREATSISLHALCNYTDEAATKCTVTLQLVGYDRDGEVLQYTASTTASTRSWQNFNFNVSSFAAAADLSAPVLLTVLTDTDAESTEQTRDFGLWVKCLRVHRPQSDNSYVFIIIAAFAGLAIGFLLILFFYRKSRKKPTRRRRPQKREDFFELNGGES